MDKETLTILLVEDDQDDVQLIKAMLAASRETVFTVKCANRLSVGMELLTAGSIDAVLLDVSLPDSQGLQPVEKLQFLDYFNVPIIVLTGRDDESFGITAVRSGAQDFLVKGEFSRGLLIRVIRHAVERKGTERQLQEAQKYTQNIINSSIDMIIAFDADWRITEFNPAAEETLGYRKDEMMGRQPEFLFVDAAHDHSIREALKGEGRFTREVDYKRKDETVFPSLLSSSAIYDEMGNVIGFMSISRDITAQKAAEEEIRQGREDAEMLNRELMTSNKLLATSIDKARKMANLADEANQAKSDFLANMSHEIRTPMNAILGMSELLWETTLNDEQQEFTRIIRTAGEGLLDLINDILDLSKIEANQLTLENVDFELARITGGVIDIFSLKADQKGIELNCHLGPDVPRYIAGDPVRLKQILINLMGNAMKFTSKGSIQLLVSVYLEPLNRSSIRPVLGGEEKVTSLLFQVKDSGIGIPPEQSEAIFGSFSQADSSTTRKFGGTGLGLTISKRLVEMMDGKIWVESEVGKGSTFMFTARFAVRSALTLEIPVQDVDQSDESREISPLRIFLVEDSEDNRKLILFYLKKTPHMVEVAVNGKLAVDRFQESSYDLVLMDMQMPIMDGFTATRFIREWEKDTERTPTPIVALTASALEKDREKCLAAGCDLHLTKPLKKSMLLQVLNRYAQAKHQQTAAAAPSAGEAAPDAAVASPATPSTGTGAPVGSTVSDVAPDISSEQQAVPPSLEKIVVTIDPDLEDLIPGYFDNRREDIQLMLQALNGGDYDKIRLTGHSMKGSGASYGFQEITVIGKKIEQAAIEKNDGVIRQAVRALTYYLEHVEVVSG